MNTYGLLKRFQDHRDLDFHKSFGTTAYDTNQLPSRYSADAGMTMPNQDADGFPEGCTGYAQTDLCTDEDLSIYDPGEFFLSTPPGGMNSGRAIRDSLNLLVNRGPKDKLGNLGPKRTKYYSINATGILDWLDAIRVALYVTSQEHRSASIAVPWFPEFENINSNGLLPDDPTFTWNNTPGHNAKCAGWTDVKTDGTYIRNGEFFLAIKSWQGIGYGDKGWCYMSRVLANAIFNMNYTEVFTATKLTPANLQTVDINIVDTIVSFIQNLLVKFGNIWSYSS